LTAFNLGFNVSQKAREPPGGRRIYLPAIQRDLQHLKPPLPGQRTIFSSLKCYKVIVYEAFLSTPALKSEALHYTLISYLLRQGVSPSIISKITRNSCLDYILIYTQEETAHRVLRKIE
jgi:hypothetical protein